MNDLIIDIGANNGEFSLELAKNNSDVTFILVEPNHDLSRELRKSILANGLKNVILYELAVGNFFGELKFNITSHGDAGISSFLELNHQFTKSDPYWSTRQDLAYTDCHKIEIVTMERLLQKTEHKKILFVKIDTQGYDLRALKSFGRFLHNLNAGMIEVYVGKDALYVGDDCSIENAISFLENNGFEIYKLKPNDPGIKEFNLFFKRPEIDISIDEVKLGLANNKIYSGKDFWSNPSAVFNQEI